MGFSINYLSVSVAKVEFYHNEPQIKVFARSTKITQFLADTIENMYQISYRNDFMPVVYTKDINQKKYKEKSTTTITSQLNEYQDHLTSNVIKYKSIPMSRDFFSALYFIRKQNLLNPLQLDLEANRNPWICNVNFVKKEKMKTVLGVKNTIKVKLDFKKNGVFSKGKSDILTNNLVSESNSLYFWFTDDELKIPVKAEYTSSPFAVTWLLTNYKS